MEISPIGIIHTPNRQATGTPLQPVFAGANQGQVEVFAPYVEGLKDLDGYDRIWLLFWCHRAAEARMTVVPYRCNAEHGLFATRAPARPNPIGLSNVRLLRVEGDRLIVEGLDMLDGSPLIDIKPYIPHYDVYPVERAGWVGGGTCRHDVTTADGRFERPMEKEPAPDVGNL